MNYFYPGLRFLFKLRGQPSDCRITFPFVNEIVNELGHSARIVNHDQDQHQAVNKQIDPREIIEIGPEHLSEVD